MKQSLLLSVFLFITFWILGQKPNTHNNCKFIQDIQNYQDSVKLKWSGNSDIIDSTTFNLQTYFSYFDNIRFEKGLTFGVYFFDNFLDGNPYLYAIKENQKLKVQNKYSLFKFLNRPKSRAKNHISPMDTENAFLQYLFFNEMAEQFALKWHANYKQKDIVCTSEEINRIVDELSYSKTSSADSIDDASDRKMFSADSIDLEKFKHVSPQILVVRNSDYYTITWIENRTHSAIFKCTYRIERKEPFDIIMTEEEKLLEIQTWFIY